MTTGAALPVTPQAAERIIRRMEKHTRRFGVEPSEPERARMIVRSCIESGASREIAYAKPGEAAALRPAALPPASLHSARPRSVAPPLQLSKVGRNDACPCGSGRKYKKCCGV
jgi:hypothetical protein